MRCLALLSLLLCSSLLAQDQRSHFRGGIGIAGGRYYFDSDQVGLDDNADAGLLQAEFEVTTRSRFGGGFRFEHFVTDRDQGLFRNPNSSFDRGTQARSSTLLMHATYRFEQHRFAMPVRVGILINGLVLDDKGSTNPEANFVSAGPFFEVEPELILLRSGRVWWSIYGQLGAGIAATEIEIDGDFRNFESASAFGMVEAGTRLHIGPTQFAIAFIGRYQSMDRSDFEGNNFVFGYDSGFQGVLFTAGFSF